MGSSRLPHCRETDGDAVMLKKGLYEQVINIQLSQELGQATDLIKSIEPIDKAEASKILAKYLATIIERGLENVTHRKEDIGRQIDLANKIIQTVVSETQDHDFVRLSVHEAAQQLLGLFDIRDSAYAINQRAEIVRPQTSIAQSSLFTGAVHEPSLVTE